MLNRRGLFVGLVLLATGFAVALVSRFGGVPLVLIDSLAALLGDSGDPAAREVAYRYMILFWYVVGVAGTFVTLDACQKIDDQRYPWIRPLASPAARALVALVLVIVLGILFDADGAFYKMDTHRDGLRQASVFGILACGMTLVIISGGIDLAVGSVLALSAVSFSLMSIHWAWTPWVAIPLCLAIGSLCGGVSGSLTAALKIQPFIATLAMMVFARGLAKTVSGGMKVSTAVPNPDGRTYSYVDVPDVFRAIDSRILGGNLSMVTLIFLVCAVAAWIALSRHRWGRELYAIGGNEEAARLSGINVNHSKIGAYAVAGLLASVAGICQAAQEQQGDPEAGLGYELTAIAIVVIGGTNLMGGRGGIGLTLIGTLTIGYLEKILSINAVPESRRLMLTGIIIVAAVLAQRRRHW